MKKTFEVVLYDLWENEEEGKWVNDVFLTGIHIELGKNFGIPEVREALKQAEFNVQEDFSIDHGSFGDRVIYFLDNMGDPYFEIREVSA